MTHVSNPSSSPVPLPADGILVSGVGLSGSGRDIVRPVRIEVTAQTPAGKDQLLRQRLPGEGPVIYTVKPLAKVALRIDDQDVTGKERVDGSALRLKRIDKDLLVATESGESLVLLHDFFSAETVTLQGADWNFSTQDRLQMADAGEGVTALSPASAAWASLGGAGAGLGVALGSTAGGGASAVAASEWMALTVVAGPVNTRLTVMIYAADGTLLQTTQTDDKGQITLPSVITRNGQPYSGPVMIKAFDPDPHDGKGHLDEATAMSRDLSIVLRAVIDISSDEKAEYTVSPITELATRLLMLGADVPSSSQPLTPQRVHEVNDTVAQFLGLASILGPALPVITRDGQANQGYLETDGLSDAEKYGQWLALLSGIDAINAGSMDATLAQLAGIVEGVTDPSVLADLLFAGAKAVQFGVDGSPSVVGQVVTLLNDAGLALGHTPLGAVPRSLNTPPDAWELKALLRMSSGELAVSPGQQRFINFEEAQDGVSITVALPGRAVEGDQLIVFLPVTGGGADQPLVVTHDITGEDFQGGLATVLITADQLAQSGDGNKDIVAVVRSRDGQLSSPVYPVIRFILDTAAPEAGSMSAGIEPTGQIDKVHGAMLTTDATPTVRGTSEPGTVVHVAFGGVVYSSDPSVSQGQGGGIELDAETGQWSLTSAPLPDGLYTPRITAVDEAGNSRTINGTPWVVETRVPDFGGNGAPVLPVSPTEPMVVAGHTAHRSISLSFNVALAQGLYPVTDFKINGQPAGIGISTVTAGSTGLILDTSLNLSGLTSVEYVGTTLKDAAGRSLPLMDIVLGGPGKDVVDRSAALSGVTLIGNGGNDQLTGSSWNDVLMGLSGDDTLVGRGGADVFRFMASETGVDTIIDFKKTEGDLLDLSSLLRGLGLDNVGLSNLDSFLQLSHVGSTAVLKVDDQGRGDFAQPSLTLNLLQAATADNLMQDLRDLVDQRVILV